MRVVAALSGGVDSAVAAARAVDAGHEVTGVHLALSRAADRRAGGMHGTGSKGCCSVEDARDARRVADTLGIPFYVWDMSEAFERDVIDDFVAEYERGHTPNPCLRCNESIKFAAVLDRARALGFEAVATGHYARIVRGVAGAELHRAEDSAKDQSYVLAVLDADQIEGALFPLGDSVKDDVRIEAERRGLLVARKPDSHDICFIPDGDTAGFLRGRLGERPGSIVDLESGEAIGEHRGAYAFTVGQRRGLALDVPDAEGARRYVVSVEAGSGTVFVGTADLLSVRRIDAVRPRWCGPVPASGAPVEIQVRAHGARVSGRVELSDVGHVRLDLDEPVRGVAPGQAAVMYAGTRVVGSATIERSESV